MLAKKKVHKKTLVIICHTGYFWVTLGNNSTGWLKVVRCRKHQLHWLGEHLANHVTLMAFSLKIVGGNHGNLTAKAVKRKSSSIGQSPSGSHQPFFRLAIPMDDQNHQKPCSIPYNIKGGQAPAQWADVTARNMSPLASVCQRSKPSVGSTVRETKNSESKDV